jgi:hypothetical protein
LDSHLPRAILLRTQRSDHMALGYVFLFAGTVDACLQRIRFYPPGPLTSGHPRNSAHNHEAAMKKAGLAYRLL